MATFSDGTTTTSYKYNEDGVRTSKTVGSTKTEFFVDGTTILAQKTGDELTVFYYDGNGKRIAIKYDDTMYYYVYNLQGDVTHIINAYGDIVGTYEYDAWGQIANLSSLTSIAQVNPFRYRGYYYDTESGLYYLNSRYYNPEWGRFINADSGIYSTNGSVDGYNLFIYCNNNPINNIDPYGNCPYNGTPADFHRLEQGLPSLDCTCMIYNKYEIITFSKQATNRSDTGLKDLSDEEIQRRARDKSLSGQERRRYQTEEKVRGLRNKQKRLSNITLEPVCIKIVGGAIVCVSAIGMAYLVVNNATVVGIIDDVVIPQLVIVFEKGLRMANA